MRENGHSTEVANLMERRMVMLQRLQFNVTV